MDQDSFVAYGRYSTTRVGLLIDWKAGKLAQLFVEACAGSAVPIRRQDGWPTADIVML